MKQTGNETLADLVVRETYRPKTWLAQAAARTPADWRASIQGARKFVLDTEMSAFVADLSLVPFQAHEVRRPEVLDSLRHGARIPFPKTWIEIDGKAFKKRQVELQANFIRPHSNPRPGRALPEVMDAVHWLDAENKGQDLDDVPPRWGWLLEEHPQLPHVIKLTEFVDLRGRGDEIVTMPFHWVWTTKDEPLPYNNVDIQAGMLAHGITGFYSPYVGVVMDKPLDRREAVTVTRNVEGEPETSFSTHHMVAEMGGVARYLICLLTTMNDIPVVQTDVRPSKGYVARGRYRKFMDYTTVRLTVPKTLDTRRLARRLIVAARRRAHEVRGHWKVFARGAAVCAGSSHLWGPENEQRREYCGRCSSWRTWVPKFIRGDASLGWVSHDYSVGKGETAHVKEEPQGV